MINIKFSWTIKTKFILMKIKFKICWTIDWQLTQIITEKSNMYAFWDLIFHLFIWSKYFCTQYKILKKSSVWVTLIDHTIPQDNEIYFRSIHNHGKRLYVMWSGKAHHMSQKVKLQNKANQHHNSNVFIYFYSLWTSVTFDTSIIEDPSTKF